jgi:hypothetical protein
MSDQTENGTRPHDQHCVWCDCEEFVAVRYLSLHHLSERAIDAVKNAVEHRAPNGKPIDGYPLQQA